MNITAVDDSNTDFTFVTSNLGNGFARIGATYIGAAPGHTGDVYLVGVTLEAVGSAGDTSPLNITILELKDATPAQNPIPATDVDGTFTIKVPVTPTPTPVPATPTPTPEPPGFGAVFAIAGLLAVAYLVLRQKRK